MKELSKSVQDMRASIGALEDYVALFYRGRLDTAYRAIAVELRKLLCGSKNNDPLFQRLYPTATFHPIMKSPISSSNSFLPSLDYRADTCRGVTWQGIPFDSGGDRLSITEWLNQPLFNEKITINELIRSVADKEAAHSDPDYNDTLRVTYAFPSPFKGYAHQEYIVYLGEYILYMLKEIQKNSSPYK